MAIDRHLPWERYGTQLNGCTDANTALKEAGLDWDIYTRSIYWADESNNLHKVPKKEAVIRADTNEFIAETRQGAAQIQNRDAFCMVDTMIDAGCEIHSAGVVKSRDCSDNAYMVLKMPETFVLDDQIDPYLIIRNLHGGDNYPLRIFSTPVRLACSNQLQILEDKSSNSIFKTNVVYDDPARNREIISDIFRIHDSRMAHLKQEATTFVGTKMSDKEVFTLINNLYPTTVEANLSATKTAKNEYYQNAILDAYNADDLANFKGTAYGLLNALSDFAGHVKKYKTDGEEDFNYAQNMADAQNVARVLILARYMIMNQYGIKFRY